MRRVPCLLVLAFAVVACLVWGVVDITPAQVVVTGGPAAFKYVNPMGESLGMLYGPAIQKEIELVPEQQQKLEKLRAEVQGKLTELYKGLGQGDPAERQQKYNDAAQALGEQTERQVREVLLPHQVKRLQQIALQMKFANAGYGYGGADALTTSDLAKILEITDEQRTQLRKKEEELRVEAARKIREFYKTLNEEARRDLFGVLTPEQRRKLESLLGDNYDWQSSQWSARQGQVQPRALPDSNKN